MVGGIGRLVMRRAKTAVGWIVFRSGIYRLLWRGRSVIVVFHRVDDFYPEDAITCGSRTFEHFARFFARYFEVIPLTELLRRLKDESALAPSLTITFDDGYRGNATIAAPILERHGLRACFFLSTIFIGTDRVPWWDRKKQIETKWMTWDQVRLLRAAGHEIGSHTETHVDLGKVSGEEARREISGGNKRVEKELGESSGLFAFPFGQRRNMSRENQTLVTELGLRCSLSAHGGTVRAGDDPFRLKRVNISDWFLSPYQFGFELIVGHLEEADDIQPG